MGSDYKSDTKYIVLELVLAIVLGAVFLIIAFYNPAFFQGKSMAGSLISFFGGLSLVFFFSVFFIGIIGAVKLKRSDKILMAIVYSICFWVLSLIVTAFLANFLSWGAYLIILAAIVYGFNLGLRHNSEAPI